MHSHCMFVPKMTGINDCSSDQSAFVMVPAVEIWVVEELFSCGVLYLALMKCLMEHVEAATRVKLEGRRNLNQIGVELKQNKTGNSKKI